MTTQKGQQAKKQGAGKGQSLGPKNSSTLLKTHGSGNPYEALVILLKSTGMLTFCPNLRSGNSI